MTFDSDIPVPKRTRKKKFYLELMTIGESYFLTDEGYKSHTIAVSAAGQAAKSARKQTGYKYIVRTVEGGTRIWRVE